MFGRNALDGNGITPIATVHYDKDPSDNVGYSNAFWNGRQFGFGDGDGIVFNYFTDSLDIVAHELTHAVTEFTAKMEYEKQSGGLNESISDVFAALVEKWFFGQKAEEADWLLGQSLFVLSTKGPALRDLAHPGKAYDDPNLGKDKQIDHFNKYHNGLDVHHSSGIPNRAFYLIAAGLGGFAWERAGKIWYETLRDPRVKQVSQNITFKQWAEVTVDKAEEFFDSSVSSIVRDAWVSVGVLP